MPEVSATNAARNFADLLDAVEHRGERFTVVRRGRAVAHIEPVRSGRGSDVVGLLERHPVDARWRDDVASVRRLLELDDRV